MKRLFDLFRKPGPITVAEGYEAYTRHYDLVVHAKDLDKVLGRLSAAEKAVARKTWDLFSEGLQAWRTQADLAALEAARRVRMAASDLSDTAIAILVDHSGSMRGQRILLAAAATDVARDFLTQLGCVVEILGFTTVSWKGGQARKLWLRDGKPAAPGRLCELLHIIYRQADERTPALLTPMMRPGLLKENVDGEALLWAASRLRALPQRRKILLIVSDGAPVDDSTLLANGPDYLEHHFREVVAALEASDDIELVALGVGYDVDRYYARAATVRTPDDLGLTMIALLERSLIGEPTSPNVSD